MDFLAIRVRINPMTTPSSPPPPALLPEAEVWRRLEKDFDWIGPRDIHGFNLREGWSTSRLGAGHTPLMVACAGVEDYITGKARLDMDLIFSLLEMNASVTALSSASVNFGQTTLVNTLPVEHMKVLVPLLQGYGMDVNQRDGMGRTILMGLMTLSPSQKYARYVPEALDVLLDAGADPFLVDEVHDRTAMDVALDYNQGMTSVLQEALARFERRKLNEGLDGATGLKAPKRL